MDIFTIINILLGINTMFLIGLVLYVRRNSKVNKLLLDATIRLIEIMKGELRDE